MRQSFYKLTGALLGLIFLHINSYACNTQTLNKNLGEIATVISGAQMFSEKNRTWKNSPENWDLKVLKPNSSDYPILNALGVLYQDKNKTDAITVFAVSKCHAITVDHAKDLCSSRDCKNMKVSLGVKSGQKRPSFATQEQSVEFMIKGDKNIPEEDISVIRLTENSFASFNDAKLGHILPSPRGSKFSSTDFEKMRRTLDVKGEYLTLGVGFPVSAQEGGNPVPVAITKISRSNGSGQDIMDQSYVEADPVSGLSCQNGMSGGPVGVFTTNSESGKKEFSVVGIQRDTGKSILIVKALEIMQQEYEKNKALAPNKYKFDSIWDEIKAANSEGMVDCSRLRNDAIQVARR